MDNEIENKIRERYRQCNAKYFGKFIEGNPDVVYALEELLRAVPWFGNIRNAYIAFNHGIHDVVKCLNCGKALKVENAIYGRHHYCCRACSASNALTNEKRMNTCIDKYGCSTPLLNDECRKKSIDTCREKFGNDMFAGSAEYMRRVPTPFRLKEVQEKSRRTLAERYGDNYGKVLFEKSKNGMSLTNMEKYGVPYVLMNREKQEQTHDTMERKYGERYFWKTPAIRELRYEVGWERIQQWGCYAVPMFAKEDYRGHDQVYRWKCTKCGNEFEQEIYVTGIGDGRIVPRCEKCYPLNGVSFGEKDVLHFVQSIYDGDVIENDQSVLSGRKELDIYIPDKRVAIEFDGLYWHSMKDRNYHVSKTEECLKKGIHLIHVFEDEWHDKQDIVKDRIRSILGVNERIYARKCRIEEIGSCKQFLNDNHLQGADFSSVRYGLYHEDELVAVMTFGRPRFNKKYDWELIRYCSRLGYNVVGGASKLLRYFMKNNSGSIISYADRRYSDGNLYEKLGFKLVGCSSPNYWYVKGNVKLSRYQCQKHKLAKMLEKYDGNLSEHENMLNNGYEKIYDSGNMIYVLEE